MRRLPGAVDIRDNLGQTRLEASWRPRREALVFYDIDETDMAAQMRIYTEFDKTGKFRRGGVEDDIDILLGSYWQGRVAAFSGPVSWSQLKNLSIIDKSGRSVPLSALVSHSYNEADQSIIHKNGRRCVTVKAKTDRTTAADVLNRLEPRLDKMQKSWPAGYQYSWAGEAEQAQETYGSIQQVFVTAVFLIFAVLALLFNSFRQPVIILFSILFGVMGVFWGFFIFDMPMSFTAAVGIVSLVGITVNDAIVMIDTMNRRRREGASVKTAAAAGAADRLRPIISTTVTTTMGLIPLAVSDPGWRPLCMAIIFGETVSTVVSLMLIPCIYLLVNREKTVPLIAKRKDEAGYKKVGPPAASDFSQ